MPKIRLVILIILIIAIPAIPFLFIYPNGYDKATLSSGTKYLVDTLTITAVFGLGLYIFSRVSFPFIRLIWIAIYTILILFIAAMEIHIKTNANWSASSYNMMMAAFTMAASPVPFIILYLVHTAARKTLKA